MDTRVDLIDRIFADGEDPHADDKSYDAVDGEIITDESSGIEPDTEPVTGTVIERASVMLATLESAQEVAKPPVTEAALQPAQPQELTKEEQEIEQRNAERHDDAEVARTNIKNMLKESENLFKSLIASAGASDDPKFYQAAAQLMKEIAGLNKDLLRLHRAEEELKAMNKPASADAQSPTTIIDKAVIVSSPAQLLANIREARKKKDEDKKD